jgi:hypothetical protein
VTVPFIRCHHVSEGARDAGGERVFLATVAQRVTHDGGGEASVRRFPSGDGNTYVFRSGNVVGRELTDQSGGDQALPVLWEGRLQPGERLLVLAHVATPTGGGGGDTTSAITALSTAIGKDSLLTEDEKATLRHLGTAAKDSAEFAPAGSQTIGAFVVLVTAPSMTHDAGIRVIPVLDARDAQSGFIGGAKVECYGLRSRYQLGVSMTKEK